MLSELSDAGVADRWGALKRRAAKIEEEIEALKADLDRRKLTFVKGLKFTVYKSVRPERRLDVAAIRVEMGKAWCAAREKPGERTSYEVNPLPKG